MGDDGPDELTPPGPADPSDDPARPQGGMSFDDWIAVRGDRRAAAPAPGAAAPPGPTAYHPIAAYGAPQPWRELDQTSVIGFALALTGIAAPIGIVFGFRGLRHTADGTKSGRWAAILAIVLGLLATLVIAAGIVGATWFRDNVKGISRVEVGECANLDDSDGLTFFPKACSDPHEMEIVATGEVDESASLRPTGATAPEFCFHAVDDRYRRAARTGDYQVTLVIDSDGNLGPQSGDAYVCFYTRSDGGVLKDAIGEEAGAS